MLHQYIPEKYLEKLNPLIKALGTQESGWVATGMVSGYGLLHLDPRTHKAFGTDSVKEAVYGTPGLAALLSGATLYANHNLRAFQHGNTLALRVRTEGERTALVAVVQSDKLPDAALFVAHYGAYNGRRYY